VLARGVYAAADVLVLCFDIQLWRGRDVTNYGLFPVTLLLWSAPQTKHGLNVRDTSLYPGRRAKPRDDHADDAFTLAAQVSPPNALPMNFGFFPGRRFLDVEVTVPALPLFLLLFLLVLLLSLFLLLASFRAFAIYAMGAWHGAFSGLDELLREAIFQQAARRPSERWLRCSPRR
jgi:hypothetical protein